MDPRHPELSLDRIDQLVNQFKRNLDNMRMATTSAQLAQLEREGGLVVQEICLVAPRMHEAMMQASRQRRHDLSHGIAFGYTPEEKPVEKPVEKADIEEPDVKEITVTPVEAVAIVEDLELVSTDTKISDDKTSIEIEQTYKPKKKTTRKKKTTKKAEK